MNEKSELMNRQDMNLIIKQNKFWIKNGVKGPESLMRAISNAVYFTGAHGVILERKFIEFFNKNFERMRFQSVKPDFNQSEYTMNPTSPEFDELNIEIAAYYFNTRFKFYFIDKATLCQQFYFRKTKISYSIFKFGDQSFAAVMKKEIKPLFQFSQGLILSIIEKALNEDFARIESDSPVRLRNFEFERFRERKNKDTNTDLEPYSIRSQTSYIGSESFICNSKSKRSRSMIASGTNSSIQDYSNSEISDLLAKIPRQKPIKLTYKNRKIEHYLKVSKESTINLAHSSEARNNLGIQSFRDRQMNSLARQPFENLKIFGDRNSLTNIHYEKDVSELLLKLDCEKNYDFSELLTEHPQCKADDMFLNQPINNRTIEDLYAMDIGEETPLTVKSNIRSDVVIKADENFFGFKVSNSSSRSHSDISLNEAIVGNPILDDRFDEKDESHFQLQLTPSRFKDSHCFSINKSSEIHQETGRKIPASRYDEVLGAYLNLHLPHNESLISKNNHPKFHSANESDLKLLDNFSLDSSADSFFDAEDREFSGNLVYFNDTLRAGVIEIREKSRNYQVIVMKNDLEAAGIFTDRSFKTGKSQAIPLMFKIVHFFENQQKKEKSG
jgi:hypothetical protein